MTYEKTVKKLLLYYPGIFPNRLYVDDHLFLVIGNGFKWEYGELVTEDDPDSLFSHLFPKFHMPWKILGFKYFIKKVLGCYSKNCIDALSIKKRYEEYTIEENRTAEDVFYPLCENFSYICNFPNDIKDDWARAILKFIEYLEESGVKEFETEETRDILKTAKSKLKKIIYDS